MSQDKNSSTLDKIKKDVILCIKLTVVFGILFVIINQQFTIKGVGIIFLFSAMYSFGLGLGNGMINEYLNTKWSWVDQTNQRLTAGIIATIFYTIIIVLLIHYVQYVLILGNNFEEFFF